MTPIPATLPGLLRRGTGVILPDGRRMTVHATDIMGAWGSTGGAYLGANTAYAFLVDLTLDLDDATSRAHLAWWILAQPEMAERHPSHTLAGHVVAGIRQATNACERGWPVSPAQFDILTTVARHLAGLETA